MKLLGFAQDIKGFFRSKTNWTGIGMIVAGYFMFRSGDVQNGMQSIIGGLALIFVRDAIAKTEVK